MSKIRAAIIFGGVSNEYGTSLLAAASVIDNINTEEYEIICLGITKKGRWLYYPGTSDGIRHDTWSEDPDCTPVIISPDPNRSGIVKLENGEVTFSRIDVAFPVLYGKNGEDGTIAGILRGTGIPYVGSDLMASAACMDKTYTRMVLKYNGFRTSEWRMMFRNELSDLDEKCKIYTQELRYPIIVKPANFGSSQSMNVASDLESLRSSIKIALAMDEKVVVEEFIEGKEIQVGIIGYDNLVVSMPGEVKLCKDAFDFSEMFSRNEYIVPAELNEDVSTKIRQIAKDAYKLMGCSGMARVDFYYTESGDIIISQINTVPEISENSMFVKLMEHSGYSFNNLIDALLTQAVDDYDSRTV